MVKTKRSRNAMSAGLPGGADQAMTDDGGAPATTGDPFLYKLLRSLREYHDRVDNKQLQTLLLQHQLTDKHPLCHLLLEGSILAEYTSPSSTIKNNSKTDFSAEDPPDAFVYWLVLSTCVLQRLVAHVKSNLACAVGAAWLSQTVTHTLLKHLPAKPERLTSASARSVVGRALIAVGTATTEALHALSAALLLPITAASSNHQEDVTAQHLATSIQACVLALDSVTVNPQTPVPTTNASTTASTTTTTGPQVYWDQTVLSWEKATDAVFHDDNNNNNNNNNALRSILASTELDWSLAEDCWQALCTVSRKGPRTASAESPVVSSLTTFKRTSRRPPTTASNPTPKTNPATSVLKNSAATEGISDSFNSIGSSAAAATAAAPGVLLILLQAFERLFQQDTTHSISLDGRLALKRWTAVALTWYGSGQEKLLVSVLRLLEAASAHSWRAEQCERTVVLFGPDQSTTVSAETEAAEEIAVPAAVEKEPPPPPSESKSKKKKKSEPPKLANEPEQTVVVVSVPSNVALITLVCRLCRIVWEIGHAAGTRPPAAGGFDTYMKAVTGTAPKKGKKLVRAELRDLAMIASYHLIQCHHACLIENYSYSSNVALVVNEDTAEDCRRRIPSSRTQKLVTGEDISSYQALYFYYPFVHKAIDELANAAAANAAGHSMPQQLYKWSDRIEYAASAFVFGAQQQVLDARLTNFAVSKLVSCLSSKTTTSGLTADAAVSSTVVSSSGVGSNNINNPSPPPKKKKDSLKLDQPLPVPSLPQSTGKQAVSRKRKSARAAAVARDLTPFCSFAGIYDERSKGDNNTSNTELTCDEKLALFIRAMSGESALSSHLIWIVEACYDTRFTEVLQSHLDNNTTDAAVVTENKTREADTLATSSLSRPSKRRKKSGGVSSGKIKAELSTHDQQATLPYLSIKGVRAGLAAEALDAMQLFLRDPFLDSSLSEIQATLREAVTVDQMHRLIELGNTVEEIVVKSRGEMAFSAVEETAKVFDATNSIFSQEEKTVWASHMNMCITLGRGRLTFDDKKISVLGDLRQTIYRKIADQSRRRSTKTSWPLWLRSAHRILMSASLTAEPVALPVDTTRQDADRFIVNGFIAELSCVLQKISTLTESLEPSGNFCATQEIALSLHDARIFLAAFARLSSDDQASSLYFLLTVVDERVTHMRDVLPGNEMIRDNGEAPALVARAITLCVNTYLMVRFGMHARDELNRVLGKSLTSRPPILRSQSEWYFSDKCFMGVFTDWEDSELPSILVSPKSVDRKSENTLQRVLENALAVGFIIATTDRCHLVYAAWNALGKCDLWNEIPSDIMQFTALPDDLSQLLLQLRDEMCLVHRKIKMVYGEMVHGTTLMRVIEEKEKSNMQRSSAVEVNILLRVMIKKASKIIDALLLKFVPSDMSMNQHIPPEVFCLLEACAVYVSFTISSYTKPSCDFFSSTMLSMTSRARNRARGYSTDSEAMHSEGGSVDSQDALVDTIERLQDVCEFLGAAPAHPDWLEKSCRLFEGASFSEAAEAAYEAQVCLTTLISVGLAQSQLSQRRAFISLHREGSVGALASKLCWLHHYDIDDSSFGESPYVNEREYKSDIGEVCDLDHDLLDVILSEAAGSGRHEAKGTWCPHSAQRVLGRFQDIFRTELVSEVESPELRACGEWEVLLAGTLTSACVHVESKKRNAKFDDDVYRFVERSERWSGVCWGALDSLVPTTALLRFGLISEGRVAHPLSSVETTTEDFESKKGALVEEISHDVAASKPIKDAVILTLATIARFPPSPTCEAIATHLMINAASFAALQGMEASTKALQALAELQNAFGSKSERSNVSASFLVERAAAVLEAYGRDLRDGDSNEPKKLSRLYSCLSHRHALPSLRFNTFLSQDVDPSSALSRANAFVNSDSTPDVWDWEGAKQRFVCCLLSYIWNDNLQSRVKTRRFFARAMSSLVAIEFEESVDQSSAEFDLLSPIIFTFNEIPEETIAGLIRKDICGASPRIDMRDELSATDVSSGFQESLCTLFAFLLASRVGCVPFAKTDLVISILENAYDTWKQLDSRHREFIIHLTLLYASRSGKLFLIGTKLFDDLRLKHKSKLDDSKAFENIKFFADFLEELRIVLSKRASTFGNLSTKETNLPRLPPSCSYAIQKDFHGQHWYNCYTCGLTNDKGCCTLCAVVCHQGHDLSYARYSSFFCDCGGEDETSSSGTHQQKCKCLSPHARDKFFRRIRSGEHETLPKERRGGGPAPTLSALVCALIVKSSFAQDGMSAMNDLTDKGRRAAWVRFLFECTKRRFDRWKSQSDEASIFAPGTGYIGSYGLLSRKLNKALDRAWTSEKLKPDAYSLMGASRSGAFQMKMSSDGMIERMKRNRMSGNGIVRSAIDADSRGRIVISESNALVFCSGLSAVNSRTSDSLSDTLFSRSSMCVISSVSIGIKVVGLKFARDCENLVYAWGTNEAKVIFMSCELTAIDFSATLDVGISADEAGSDVVVNSHWLPGSGSCLVVGCSNYLRVFDVSKPESIVTPVATIVSESCSSKIRDFAITPTSEKEADVGILVKTETRWNAIVLLDNGTLLEATITRSRDGKITAVPSLQPNEFMAVLQKTSNADSHVLAASAAVDLSAQGASLTFLEQSNVLLYQTLQSGTLAILLNEKGDAKGAFKLLPFEIPSSLLEKNDDCRVTGPYTHWRELGIAQRGSADFFRVCCSGLSSTASEPVLLCLEFNESGAKVQELAKDSSGWFDPPQSLEGSAVFTAPLVYEDRDTSDLSADKAFAERVILCALTLNGCLRVYAENLASPTRSALEPTCSVESLHFNNHAMKKLSVKESLDPSFQLLAIERLTNVTEFKRVTFSGDGLGTSENIRSKLRADSESFLVSPRPEGFTLAISLRGKGDLPDAVAGFQYCSQSIEPSDLVIAAVRVLVGSSSRDLVPRSVKVMGRVHKLIAGARRWYTFHLTAQELAFSIRNGFLSIEIDECMDSSSSPALDSLEVYALERRKIERWLPSTLQSVAATLKLDECHTDGLVKSNPTRDSFRLSLMASASLNSLLGSLKPNRTEKAFLKQLVQDTALENDQQIVSAVNSLVSSVEHDEESRQSFHDKAVLSGCSAFLLKCQRSLETVKRSENRSDFYRLWHALVPSLRTSLQVAARVARLRPFNYLQAADGSIAADASKFISECLSISISDDDLVSDFVELSLLESAVANGTLRGRSGPFDGLRSLLASSNHEVVFQTCASISRFCRVSDIFTSQTMAVKYVCDSCLLFINDTRYTLLDDDHTFDLCPDCYQLGKEYVQSRKFDSGDNVIINGKTVGESQMLTCTEVQTLQPVAIIKSVPDEDAFDRATVDAKLEECSADRLLKLASPKSSVGAEIAHQQQLFNDFMDGLFTGIAGLLGDELKKQDAIPSSLVWLSVDLVRHSIQSGRKIDRAKRLAEAMASGLSLRLESAIIGHRLSDDCLPLLEGLTSLFAPDKSARDYILGTRPNLTATESSAAFDSTAFACDGHRAPVVLQKFTQGHDKDRCFLACSQDSKHKCNYFVWAEEGLVQRNENQPAASLFSDDIAKLVWDLFTSPLVSDSTPLHLRLCAFIDQLTDRTLNQETPSSGVAKISLVRATCCDIQKGFADGVLCSHGRLRDDATQEILLKLYRRSRASKAGITTAEAGRTVVEKSLELISLIARPDTDGSSQWFPVLSKIILSDKGQGGTNDDLRLLAKRSLRQICGKNTGLSHAVRDHFVFSFHYEKLLKCAESILNYCVLLNEKARQSGPLWKASEPMSFHGLRVHHVVGTEALISEDVSTLRINEVASKILSELWAVANKRGDSWRRFSGLRKVPTCVSNATTQSTSDCFAASPIISLFAVACSLSFEHQLKALRLINLALIRPSERKLSPHKHADMSKPRSSDDERETESTDVIIAKLPTLYADCSTPEEILDVSIEDVHAFVIRFVCRGNMSEVRTLSCTVAIRLCRCLNETSQGALFDRFMRRPLCRAGIAGKRYSDFFMFLQLLLRLAGPNVIDVATSSALVQSHFKQQMLAIRHDRGNGEFMHFESKSSTSVQKKRFDLATCSSCRVNEPRSKEKCGDKTSSHITGGDGRMSSTSRTLGITTCSTKTKWLSEQVSLCSRSRLDAGRDFSTSDEFCSFYMLKHRCVVSAIHAEVDNPRRFVKTINFFFSPRPVEDVNILKLDEFSDSWQPCGVLILARGCSRASLTLSTPVVAANLKIEYADFYERPGGTKTPDGTLIVHCPRCTRVVTNAHGVCANCGEVAFQCRKCRHINYDRLDAFLCVECGFCASGTFQYELTAAVATNAVAITNDHDCEKATQRAIVASRLHEELKMALTQKLLELARGRKKTSLDNGDKEDGGLEIPSLKRAFEGILPLEPGQTEVDNHLRLTLSQLGKPGSIVKIIARADAHADHPQSLFRTSGLLRSDVSSSRTDHGLMIQSLSRDIDEDDTASDLLGDLLERSNRLSQYAGLDPGDPVSLLLADVRRDRRENEGREALVAAQQPLFRNNKAENNNNAKETIEVCDRLYQLMREAEREAYELGRRCAAWSRLDKGCLAETGRANQPFVDFEPSHCSICAATIALQLLVLWLRLFQLNPNAVVINQELILLLLNEDSTTVNLKNLLDTKRSTVKEIALLSKQGSPLVLEALRLRLILMQDVNVAEILGKILESLGGYDADAAAPFVALAREALESNN